jgi:L-amino acid N-acyltransferase YncA
MTVDGATKEELTYNENATYFTNEYGFMMFRGLYPHFQEVHICMKKGAKNVDEFAMKNLQAMREQGVKKFLAPIGEWNTPALKLAKRCGFIEEGRITKAYQRNGLFKSMVLLGAE